MIYNKLVNLSRYAEVCIFFAANRVKLSEKRRIHMKTRRILSVVLAVMMVLTTFTFASVSVSAAAPEVYVDQTNGSDSNNGTTPEKAVQTFNAAFDKVEDGGTIYIVGTYLVENEKQHLPSSESTKAVVVEGYDDTSRIETASGLGIVMRAPMTFRNIKMFGGGSGYAHLNTYANKLVLGEGYVAEGYGQIHVGPLNSGTVPNVHLVIDGANVTKAASIGGAYLSNSGHGITGDATVEVLSGTLNTLKLTQDGYADGHLLVTLGGNLNVRIGADGKINKMTNSPTGGGLDRSTVVKGYLQLILEGGAQMPALDLTHFENKKHYEIRVADTANGRVDFTSEAGVFNIIADDGYVAKIEYDGKVSYVGAGTYSAPIGEVVSISFTDEKKVAPSEVDVIITPATPGETVWPISVSDDEHFVATINTITPDHAEVGYAIPYTYEISLATTDSYVLPADFTFTINGSSEYRIEKISESYDEQVFTYTAEMTAKDETRAMISYVGGIGTAGKAPYNKFADFNSDITVDQQYFTQGGYEFMGYTTNGTDLYKHGDTFAVGTEDVVFTAVWKELEKIQVVFDGNGATGGYAPDKLEDFEGKYVTVSECTFANTGFVFTNWKDEAGKIYNPGDLILLSSNLVLSAQWEVNPVAGDFIYVNSAGGSDSNDGLTPETAVSSLAQAVALANGENVTIIVIGGLTVDGTLPENAGNVTITGYDEESALIIKKSVALGSATIIENIKINASEGAYIATNGQKAVIGPNLENLGVKYDIVDGGIDTTVDFVDTEIKTGVTVGTYYLGGVDLTDKTRGIAGNVEVTVDGADIKVIDFAPRGDTSTQSTIGGHIVFNVNGGNIGDFVASKVYAGDRKKVVYIFFNNSTIPVLSASKLNNLVQGKPLAYVIDSGDGGAVEIYGDTPALNGRVTPTADTTKTVWRKLDSSKEYEEMTKAEISVTRFNNQANYSRIRYGEAFKGDIAATIVEPTGGAEASSITATPVDTSITDVVTIQLSGWTPELINDVKFDYEKQYAANVLISLKDGYFFDDKNLPAVILNGKDVGATVNSDGTLSASYQFSTKTGYAPELKATYQLDDSGATIIHEEFWKHLSSDKLYYDANAISMLGYRFAGWKCSEDGKIYSKASKYTFSGNSDVTFTAEWAKRGGWELPNVIILYDLSAYGRDKGRNPEFEKDDSPILVTKPFANLEYAIDGKKTTISTNFDYETATVIASDGAGKAFTINDYTLNRTKADTHEYTHLTIIYYYQSKTGAAVGDYGHINYGNVILADGSKSNWFGKPVLSNEPVVANKWACVTWDFTEFNETYSVPEGSMYNQFHISPIGTKSLSELKGDTLYLKAMYFSKYPAITK